jgi:ATP-dependent helicase HrpB
VLGWDARRDDLVEQVTWRLGGLLLDEVVWPADPGPQAEAALLERVRSTRLGALAWSDAARALRQRVAFLRATFGSPWPDWSDAALAGDLTWLAPRLAGAASRADLERVDVAAALRARLDPALLGDMERLAPTHLPLPGGRRLAVDYADEQPSAAVRVQDLFGTETTPTVAGGRVPVVLHLLSPAGRPVQVTSDLAGFWAGSWHEVRKAMAGRYPKHAWPEDPRRPAPGA